MDLKSKIILIAGPTASGKSKFAIKFAKKINGEIIKFPNMLMFAELTHHSFSKALGISW